MNLYGGHTHRHKHTYTHTHARTHTHTHTHTNGHTRTQTHTNTPGMNTDSERKTLVVKLFSSKASSKGENRQRERRVFFLVSDRTAAAARHLTGAPTTVVEVLLPELTHVTKLKLNHELKRYLN